MKISWGFVSSLEAISAIFSQNYALFVKKKHVCSEIKFYDMRRYAGESWYANITCVFIINVKSSAFELI